MTINTSSKKLNQPEPAPTKKSFPAVWDLVYADIIERDKKGKEKYGTRLQPFNGRDGLKDAYQKSLDLTVYLRQALFERDYNEAKEKFGVHQKDSLMCECPACRKIGAAYTPSSDEYCSCTGAAYLYFAKDAELRCRRCERLISRKHKS